MFWAAHMHYGTCCDLFKTSADRCFGHTSHIMEHDVICSKRLPAGVLGTPSTPGTQWNMLQHAQNVCLQVFWTFSVITTDQKRIKKRNGVNEVGLSFGVNTKTSAGRWFWINPKPIFWSIFSSKIGAVSERFLYNETCCNMLKTSACRCFEHFLL